MLSQVHKGVISNALWIIVFFVGINLGMFYSVLQTYYCTRFFAASTTGEIAEDSRSSGTNENYEFAFLLFYQTLFLMLQGWAVFAMDILPYFGLASSIQDFGHKLADTVACSFGAHGGDCWYALIFNITFNVGYLIVFWFALKMNKKASDITSFDNLFVTLLSIIIAYLYPPLNPDKASTDMRFIIPSFVLMCIGLFWWIQQRNKDIESASEPEGAKLLGE